MGGEEGRKGVERTKMGKEKGDEINTERMERERERERGRKGKRAHVHTSSLYMVGGANHSTEAKACTEYGGG